jgi:hypothetical protein
MKMMMALLALLSSCWGCLPNGLVWYTLLCITSLQAALHLNSIQPVVQGQL